MTDSLITANKKERKSHTPKDSVGLINQGIPRLDKAYQILDKVTITTTTNFQCLASDGVTLYSGDFVENICTCPDNSIRGQICKHIRAAKIKNEKFQEQFLERGLIDTSLLEQEK